MPCSVADCWEFVWSVGEFCETLPVEGVLSVCARASSERVKRASDDTPLVL